MAGMQQDLAIFLLFRLILGLLPSHICPVVLLSLIKCGEIQYDIDISTHRYMYGW